MQQREGLSEKRERQGWFGTVCEETVVRDGQPGACGRPTDRHGLCDRPGDHAEG